MMTRSLHPCSLVLAPIYCWGGGDVRGVSKKGNEIPSMGDL